MTDAAPEGVPPGRVSTDDDTPPPSPNRLLLTNSSALVFSRLVTAVLGWAGTVVIARTLAPDDWGRYSFIFGLLGIMALVTDLGVGRVVLARLTADDHTESRAVAGSFILLRMLLGVLGFAVAVGYAAVTGLSVTLVAVIAFAATTVVLATPANALLVLYQARLRLVGVAVWDVVAQVVQFALVLAIASLAPTLIWFIIPAIAKELVVIVARSVGVLRGDLGARPDFSAGARYWGEMLREAIPISIGFALIMLLTKIDILILQRLDTYDSVGMYAIGYKFSDLVIMVTVTISVPFTTVLVRAWPYDLETFRHRVRQSMVVAGGLGALAVVAFWPTAHILVGLLYGESFVESSGAARLLVVSSAISGVTNIGLIALVAARKLMVFPWVAGIGVALNVGLNYLVIPRWSYEGAAAATLVTEAIMFLACLALVQGSLGIPRVIPWGALFRLILLAVAVVGPATMLVDFTGWPWIPVVAVALLLLVALAEFSRSLEDISLLGRFLPTRFRRRVR